MISYRPPRLRQAVESSTFQKNAWFDGRYVRKLEALHASGRIDLSFVLWQLLGLDVWWQETLPRLTGPLGASVGVRGLAVQSH